MIINSTRNDGSYERLNDDYYQIINYTNDDIILNIYGYKNNNVRSFFYHFTAILFLGLPYLLYSWYINLKKLKYKKCCLKDADYILLKDNYDHSFIINVIHENYIDDGKNKKIQYFIYQHVKYVWEDDSIQFAPLKLPCDNVILNDLLEKSHGLTTQQQRNSLQLYGNNTITIEIKSYFQLLIQEVFNPFYLFQIFSIILWNCDEYYVYAACILILSIISIATSLYETRKQSLVLHNLVASSVCKTVNVCRPKLGNPISTDTDINDTDFDIKTIDSNLLVPNDLIVLPSNESIMPCDAVLLKGLCIVNESMLTGESAPVTKTPPTHCDELYNIEIHKRHTLFAGTKIMQTRFYGGNKVIARVLRTGFYTSKGELVKSILYPKPTGLQFYRDAMKFVLFLTIIATAGMIYCMYLYKERNAELREIIIRALDIITIVIPPALPAAMTVGTIYSQNRLKKKNIFCISPPRINTCGKLKLVCFDKTGTLTEDGLDFGGVLSVNKTIGLFDKLIVEPDKSLQPNDEILHAMATCHSLTSIDNKLMGDPLDLAVFEATKWNLEEPGNENARFDLLTPTIVKPPLTSSTTPETENYELINDLEIGILKQFSFSSSQQCMSVICRRLGARHMTAYVKGAPERLQSMCNADSLPIDFNSTLEIYAALGYRIIAIAYKQLPPKLPWKDAMKMKREKIECNLTFLGLILLRNELKPQTVPVINDLHLAQIKTVMITGDNIMTAISVARQCNMVLPHETIVLLKTCCDQTNIAVEILRGAGVDTDCNIYINSISTSASTSNSYLSTLSVAVSTATHFALDGRTWSVLLRNNQGNWSSTVLSRIVRYGTIFARFRPEQKAQLVEQLQTLDYVVAMCGDGANDCGALRAADVGVSLSQAEASVAAPFTSAEQNISCVKSLMLEGRCALVTSFAMFKYMAMYSLIQFFTILILYKRYTTLGNMQFLYIDLIITTSLAVTMGYQGPATKLATKRPMGSLISLVNVIPLMLQIILCGVVQYGALYYLTLQSWFRPLLKSSYDTVEGEMIICWENTVVFCVSCYQYVILACVYSRGRPHRESSLRNGFLILTVIILTAFTTLLLVYPIEPLAKFFEMIPISTDPTLLLFRVRLLLFPLAHLILAYLIEVLIGQRRYLKRFAHFVKRKKQPKNRYKLIEQSIDINQWMDICMEHSNTAIAAVTTTTR